MMRDILFRGKRIDNGEWVCGGYWLEKVGGYITAVFITENLTDGVHEHHRVDPDTVGQYTDLKDKNGKRIFEGDIVALTRSRFHEVKWSDGGFSLVGTAIPIKFIDRFELVGTVHDNPELIGGME